MSIRDVINCRDVLWWMVFSGLGVNFMLRVNLNLVLVATAKQSETPVVSQCGEVMNNTFIKSVNNFSVANNETEEMKQVQYSEYEQGLAIGAYYWIHWLSEIPGGVLARKYGTKMIFGVGNLLAAILGVFLSVTMQYSLYSLIFIRVLQGLVAGVAYPATHDLTAKWIPQKERSKFVSAYMGGSVGIALTYPLSGFIIDYLGWESVFYITSVLGIIWWFLWISFVYDTPQQHPRISEKEKKYILDNLGTSVDHSNRNLAIPWSQILTSWPVWTSVLSNWGAVWGYFTLMAQAPAYFKFIHGWSVEKTGIFSGLPHFLTMFFSWIFAHMSDWLLQTERLTLTEVRKLATIVSSGLPSFLILGLAFSGCYPVLAVILIMGGIASAGAVTSGPLSNLVDLSPNYASILLGICGLVIDIAGFVSPIIVGFLTNDNQTIGQWRLIFIIAFLNMAICCLIFCIWGTAEEQSWNQYHTVSKNEEDYKIDIELKPQSNNHNK
ncbi:GSCOCG00006502001-RA-CDS [Cotesia congregata]|nr:GSCOCG00006502001-RA-CDS [Cotesia congregata]